MKDSWIKFADHYLKSNNATAAYKSAYPKCTNDASAWTLGSNLLRNVKVAEYIKEKQTELAKKEIITKEAMLVDLKYLIAVNLDERPQISIKAMELVSRLCGYEIKQTKSVQQDITTTSGEKITINLNLE